MRFQLLICGVLALLTPFATPLAGAASAAEFTRDEIGGIVKDYIMEHPEVLKDALTALAKKEKDAETAATAKLTTDMTGDLYASTHQAVVGNPKGKTVLVEFFDYNCGYCKKSIDDISALMKQNPDLKVILKDFPVLGQGSIEASKVATAVRNQLKGDAFWEYHKALLLKRNPSGVGKADAMEIAKAKGVDMDKLAKDMTNEDNAKGIFEVMKMGDRLGLTGTPSFVVGGEVVVGAVGFDALHEKITNTATCGKSIC